jgi:hypothetical protein
LLVGSAAVIWLRILTGGRGRKHSKSIKGASAFRGAPSNLFCVGRLLNAFQSVAEENARGYHFFHLFHFQNDRLVRHDDVSSFVVWVDRLWLLALVLSLLVTEQDARSYHFFHLFHFQNDRLVRHDDVSSFVVWVDRLWLLALVLSLLVSEQGARSYHFFHLFHIKDDNFRSHLSSPFLLLLDSATFSD